MTHLSADAEGMPLPACSAPADEDERKQAGPLLEMIAVQTGKPGRPPQKLRRTAADKGYDSDPLRDFLKSKGIRPQIPRKKNASKRRGRPVSMKAPRFQVERTFSWLQRKFRRLVVRGERLPRCFVLFSPWLSVLCGCSDSWDRFMEKEFFSQKEAAEHQLVEEELARKSLWTLELVSDIF